MAELNINRPNWLGSEVGLLTKTVGLSPAATITPAPVAEGNQLVAKSGSYVESHGLEGLLFHDVDLTGATATTEKLAALMIGGRYLVDKLPEGVAALVADLNVQGLYAFDEGSVTRPDFGTVPEPPFGI